MNKYIKLCLALALASLGTSAAFANQKAVQAGHVFDAVDGRMRGESTILIDGDRIVSVVQGYVSPEGYEVIDRRSSTVLPGLIDCHVHLNHSDNVYTKSDPTPDRSKLELALLSPDNAKKTLLSGFTSIRDVGAWGGSDLLLKQAIDRGDLEGPRMFVALEGIGPTGGHSDPANGHLVAEAGLDRENAVADGVDAVTRLIRDHKRRGANLIKIMPGGGIGTPGDDPNRQLMTDAEIRAAVETAHWLGMKVAAHAE